MSPVLEVRAVNFLLGDLTSKARQTLLETSEFIALTRGEILGGPDTRRRYVYFPTDSVISLRARAGDKEFLDVALIGSEGMLALPQMPSYLPLRVQVAQSGHAWRIPLVNFDRALASNYGLKRLLETCLSALLAQIAQIAACTCFHDLEARLARQLLMMGRCSQTAHFYLTHTLLAESLGVRRGGVTRSAATLQRRKLIRYSRGNITILNRRGLEKHACACYRAIADQSTRVP
jgi:CRP-like cAMP-binding protein